LFFSLLWEPSFFTSSVQTILRVIDHILQTVEVPWFVFYSFLKGFIVKIGTFLKKTLILSTLRVGIEKGNFER